MGEKVSLGVRLILATVALVVLVGVFDHVPREGRPMGTLVITQITRVRLFFCMNSFVQLYVVFNVACEIAVAAFEGFLIPVLAFNVNGKT